ncbi:hypothetical protein D915_004650 [Fasciola hepatica]|uniref:Uncharacterized protein n=1 Tax=Fasciola hepatica TaxID=6192 RepID=A0A4E0RDM5_FASHE|nr:hypothetical protein D915_004650 [Fasciola hepatica]
MPTFDLLNLRKTEMTLQFVVKTIQLLILITLHSQYVHAEQITGSMFRIQLPISPNSLKPESMNNMDPYAEWNPACYKFHEATTNMSNDIKNRLVGCASEDIQGREESTHLKIYLAISPNQLRPDQQVPCLNDAYQKAFDALKEAVSLHFKVHFEQVQIFLEFKEVQLQAQRITSLAMEDNQMLFDSTWTDERKLKVKVFLLSWMRSINNRFPLISMKVELMDISRLDCKVDVWFDVTGKTDEALYYLFASSMKEILPISQKTFGLKRFSEKTPDYVAQCVFLVHFVKDPDALVFEECAAELEQYNIPVEIMTGSAFEVHLDVDENDWDLRAKSHVNPFSGWRPICDWFMNATALPYELISEKVIGCRSNRTGTKTQLTVYLAVPLADLTAKRNIRCKKDLFTQWEKTVRIQFKLQPDGVQFTEQYREVQVQAITIVGELTRNGGKDLSQDKWSDKEKLVLKPFLVHWMKSIDKQYKLVSFKDVSDDLDPLVLEMDLLFDITGQDNLNLVNIVRHLTSTASSYQGSSKLTSCRPDTPAVLETPEDPFVDCVDGQLPLPNYSRFVSQRSVFYFDEVHIEFSKKVKSSALSVTFVCINVM